MHVSVQHLPHLVFNDRWRGSDSTKSFLEKYFLNRIFISIHLTKAALYSRGVLCCSYIIRDMYTYNKFCHHNYYFSCLSFWSPYKIRSTRTFRNSHWRTATQILGCAWKVKTNQNITLPPSSFKSDKVDESRNLTAVHELCQENQESYKI